MLRNEIVPLVSQVMPSHSAKSHGFVDVQGGIYLQNVFPSPIIHQKPPQAGVKTFCELRDFFPPKFGVSLTRF